MNQKIATAEDRWPAEERRSGVSAMEHFAATYWPATEGKTPLGTPGWLRSFGILRRAATAEAPAVRPIINHARWILQCPYCPNAVFASKEDHRFWCSECFTDDSMWLPVEWPLPATVERLERTAPPTRIRQHY